MFGSKKLTSELLDDWPHQSVILDHVDMYKQIANLKGAEHAAAYMSELSQGVGHRVMLRVLADLAAKQKP